MSTQLFVEDLLLKSWRIPIRQIGYEVGRKGIKDAEIIPSKEQEFAKAVPLGRGLHEALLRDKNCAQKDRWPLRKSPFREQPLSRRRILQEE